MSHTSHKDIEPSTIEARWRNTDWLTDQVITEWKTFSLPGDTSVCDKIFWTSNKPAQWTYIYRIGINGNVFRNRFPRINLYRNVSTCSLARGSACHNVAILYVSSLLRQLSACYILIFSSYPHLGPKWTLPFRFSKIFDRFLMYPTIDHFHRVNRTNYIWRLQIMKLLTT
jgi:hypothetical protein